MFPVEPLYCITRVHARITHQSREKEHDRDDGSHTDTLGRAPMTTLSVHENPEREDIENTECPKEERLCEEKEELLVVSAR